MVVKQNYYVTREYKEFLGVALSDFNGFIINYKKLKRPSHGSNKENPRLKDHAVKGVPSSELMNMDFIRDQVRSQLKKLGRGTKGKQACIGTGATGIYVGK